MNELSKRYLEEFKIYIEAARNFSPHTIRAYNSDILSFLIWLDERSLKDVTYAVISDYLLYIRQFDYKKSTVSRKTAALRTFFKFLHRERIIDSKDRKSVV